MKILWLSHVLPYPPKAGVLLRSYHLLRGLSKGNEVDVIAFNQPALMRSIVPDEQKGREDAVRKLSEFCAIRGVYSIPSDVSVWRRRWLVVKGFFGENGYTIDWLQSSEFAAAVRYAMQQTKYDVVHLDTISFLPFLPLVDRAPVALDHHNIESHMMFRRAGQEKGLVRRMYFSREAEKLEHWERYICTRVAHNITCSEVDTRRLREIAPGSSVSTVPNAVDCDYFSPGRVDVSRNDVIFIGTMSWYPNVQAVQFLICEIWPRLRERHPGLRLNIVGAGAPHWLIELGRNSQNVIFHGFVDDIRILMNRSAAFLCPISDGGGTKLKVLDALAMAIPLVAHPVACEGIDVTHGQSVLFAQSPEEYGQAMDRLLGDPAFAESLGRKGRDLVVKTYSAEGIGAQMRSLYADLCAH
jgi:glycosyltransferase involved in cell wall biosynthesis